MCEMILSPAYWTKSKEVEKVEKFTLHHIHDTLLFLVLDPLSTYIFHAQNQFFIFPFPLIFFMLLYILFVVFFNAIPFITWKTLSNIGSLRQPSYLLKMGIIEAGEKLTD